MIVMTWWIVIITVAFGTSILLLLLQGLDYHRRIKNLEYLERLRSESEARSIPRPRVP